MMEGHGQLSVPPGFRFHPTEEELLYYYLRKKVSCEAIILDVIKEVDLNKLEPWDLKEKCRIGSGPQNEWYFFSHKDKKYPTGTRTNRATSAGFWKATGRDKGIHLSSSKRIGLRKTLVFYIGRAPHGQKTDWIMYEYRLDDDNTEIIQEDGWVVCRVFKKKNHIRGIFHTEIDQQQQHQSFPEPSDPLSIPNSQLGQHECTFEPNHSIHLPHLFIPPEPIMLPVSFMTSIPLDGVDMHHDNPSRVVAGGGALQPEKFAGDWSFLDKLLAMHQSKPNQFAQANHASLPAAERFSLPYIGFQQNVSK